MENFKQTQLHKKLKLEHKKHRERRPLIYLLSVLAGCLLLSFISYLIAPLYCYDICFYIFISGNVLGVIIFLITYIGRRENISKTAQRLDEEHEAKNRLESALELVDTDHSLKTQQHLNTTEFYSAHKFSRWKFMRVMVVALMLFLLWVNSRVLQAQQLRYQHEIDKSAKLQQKKLLAITKKPKQPISNDKAELKLILPESEIRAKPLDEIEWSGAGHSTRGFKKLILTVYVNGEFIKNIMPEIAPLTQPGNLKTGGFITLDEFNVKPFDLLSYHLTGYTQINGEPDKKIISTPQFIEVRPFREDAFIAKAGDGGGQKMLNVLIRFLQLQVVLNKATFTARIMRQHGDKEKFEEFKKLLPAIKKEQQALNSEVEEFLNSEIARKFPADAINNVEKAQTSLKATWQQLQSISTKEL